LNVAVTGAPNVGEHKSKNALASTNCASGFLIIAFPLKLERFLLGHTARRLRVSSSVSVINLLGKIIP
jgi:hypothetical protein